MNDVKSATNAKLQIRRTFKAPRARVFAAWTQPEVLKEWFAPPPGWTIPDAEMDVRVGGAYRVTFADPAGGRSAVYGVFREVCAPERLSYTWRGDHVPSDTLVTIDFYDRGQETELVLTHEDFLDETSRERHERGWRMSLANLDAAL
jgi:uncharacterized protein YndB with AHSA1/START domain